ncbi:MAG: DMT family transporter [Rhizobiales bacterium]|nr:DMT family transporter [Hyphomicrobiales bacterium]
MRIFILVSLAMIAFAGNSVFARLGLGSSSSIDPASYTLIRLISGAVVLTIVVSWRNKSVTRITKGGNWVSALALFGYASAFSYAYVVLETGMGALILFTCVQAGMIAWGIFKGDRPIALEWLGLIIAFSAFVWLVSPGLQAPDPFAAFLMFVSGISWAVYSTRGKNTKDALNDPLGTTTGNFIMSIPFALILLIALFTQVNIDAYGAYMAIGSGILTSALGYAIWYMALPLISQTQAAIVQLTVPVIAGFGGVLFSSEIFTTRFAISATLILGGVAIAILAKSNRTKSKRAQ